MREKIMEMVVEDSQLSLAIGKKGQNVRLASKLIGWRIDIKSEEEKRAEIESQIDRMQETVPTPLADLSGLTPSLVQSSTLQALETVEQLANLAPEDLENIPGIGARHWKRSAKCLVSSMPSNRPIRTKWNDWLRNICSLRTTGARTGARSGSRAGAERTIRRREARAIVK